MGHKVDTPHAQQQEVQQQQQQQQQVRAFWEVLLEPRVAFSHDDVLLLFVGGGFRSAAAHRTVRADFLALSFFSSASY